MEITCRTDITPATEQVIGLYDDAGLPRPTGDRERIQQMYANSNLRNGWNSTTKMFSKRRSSSESERDTEKLTELYRKKYKALSLKGTNLVIMDDAGYSP